MNKMMKYAPTAHNRTVYASPPLAAWGFVRPGHSATLIPAAHCTHSLPALKLLRIFLFGLSNRRKQPERYAQLVLRTF
jgi:hypothetical protein